MPYDSLVALGGLHSQTLVGGSLPSSIDRPLQCMKPTLPADPPEALTVISDYVGPTALPAEQRELLQSVYLDPGKIAVHPAWRGTAVGGAMDEEDRLDLTRISPDMMRALPEVTRKSLLDMLRGVEMKIAWVDYQGRKHARQSLLWMPIGHRWTVNGATALALCMAADPDPTALREVLLDGLVNVIDQLHGSSANIFTAEDVVWVVLRIIEKVIGNPEPIDCQGLPCFPGEKPHPGVSPVEANALLNAAATLIERYLQQTAHEDPSAIRVGIQRLMQELAPNMPVDAAHMGLGLGLILAGGFRYVGGLSAVDFRVRWRVASVANMIWVSQNFVPCWFISGPIAAVAVGGAIWWDYNHPPRDYNDVIRRFDSEFMLLALRGQLALSPAQATEMQLWMRQVLCANNFNG